MKKRIVRCLSMAIVGSILFSTPVFAEGDDPEANTEVLEENPGDNVPETTDESSEPLSFDGTGTIVDNVQQGSKQFYTISTDAGNVFYLIIDLDKDSNNVYFLDTTKERDLVALAEKAEAEENGTNTASGTTTETITENKDDNTDSAVTDNNDDTKDSDTEEKNNNSQTQAAGVPWGMLVIVLLAGVGVVVYYWIIKPKKDREEAEEFEETFDFMDDEITPDDSYEEEDTYGRIGGDDE